MILVTGPTGSGKTTTLYAALREQDAIGKNILTVEDPIEYELLMIRQTQVNTKAGYTFASAIRTFLRQDPDLMLIGEIRDEETAKLAVRAPDRPPCAVDAALQQRNRRFGQAERPGHLTVSDVDFFKRHPGPTPHPPALYLLQTADDH